MEILEVSKISNNNPFQRMEFPDISNQNIMSVYSFQRKEIPEVYGKKYYEW